MRKSRTFYYARFAIFALMITSVHCTTQQHPGNPALVNTWIEALNKHHVDELAKLYTDSAKIESPNWEGDKTGPAGIKEAYGRYFASTPDLQQVLTHVISTDSNLVIEYISTGTLENPESNAPAYMKGKHYTLKNCTRLDIAAGKITRQINYFDQVAFLRQVGFFEQH